MLAKEIMTQMYLNSRRARKKYDVKVKVGSRVVDVLLVEADDDKKQVIIYSAVSK